MKKNATKNQHFKHHELFLYLETIMDEQTDRRTDTVVLISSSPLFFIFLLIKKKVLVCILGPVPCDGAAGSQPSGKDQFKTRTNCP